MTEEKITENTSADTPSANTPTVTSEITKIDTTDSTWWTYFFGSSKVEGSEPEEEVKETPLEDGELAVVCRDNIPIGWYETIQLARKRQNTVLTEIIEELNTNFDLCKVTIDKADMDDVCVFARNVTWFNMYPSLYSSVSVIRVPKGVETGLGLKHE
jgi:hypothetical protein